MGFQQGLIPLLMARVTAYFPLETIYTPPVHEMRHPGGAWPSMEGACVVCLACKHSHAHARIY